MLFKLSLPCFLLFFSAGALATSEHLVREEVARFFELTQAIDVGPVKKRVGVLINRRLRHNNSGIQREHYQAVEQVVAREVDNLSAQKFFFEEYYQVYKQHYTLDELREINAFFSSDVGKKFIHGRQDLHQDVSTTTVKMIHRLVDTIAPKVQQTLARSGYDVDL
ncbi:DUF2059 domain-containing protein [Litoribrevibacter euphylliae]|uniref:DUF2059 domain-containing protein n=1 Tax=Litoribrevibacter euphylliae TaxID=1834034 RepID=A0ABV7HDG6_9GAMM